MKFISRFHQTTYNYLTDQNIYYLEEVMTQIRNKSRQDLNLTKSNILGKNTIHTIKLIKFNYVEFV
jgi:hypothetical protein